MQKCRMFKIIELYMSQLDRNAFITISWSFVWLILSYVSNVSFLVKFLRLANLLNLNMNQIRLRSGSYMIFFFCRIFLKFGIKYKLHSNSQLFTTSSKYFVPHWESRDSQLVTNFIRIRRCQGSVSWTNLRVW